MASFCQLIHSGHERNDLSCSCRFQAIRGGIRFQRTVEGTSYVRRFRNYNNPTSVKSRTHRAFLRCLRLRKQFRDWRRSYFERRAASKCQFKKCHSSAVQSGANLLSILNEMTRLIQGVNDGSIQLNSREPAVRTSQFINKTYIPIARNNPRFYRFSAATTSNSCS